MAYYISLRKIKSLQITQLITMFFQTISIQSICRRCLVMMALTAMTVTVANAQRIQQRLGRGVVAVQNGSSVTVTWRKLAQEPENAKYNVYIRKNGATDYVKINNTPLSNTNYKTTTTSVPLGSEVAVRVVTVSGSDMAEGELSTPFKFKSLDLRNMYMNI